MYVYVINMILIYFENLITKVKNSGKSYKKLFCALVSLQFILISGLRAITIGADTPVYEELFVYYHSITWKEMLDYFIAMFTQSVTYESRDMAYYLFTKIFSAIIPSYRAFLFFVIIVFMIGFSKFVYKYSADCCLSYLIFASFMFAFFGLTGIRQTFTTIICVFLGFELIKKRKFFPFLLTVLFASMVHKTSLVFLPFYFVYNIRITKLYKVTVAVVFGIVFLLKNKLVFFLTRGTYAKYAELPGEGPYNLLFFITMIVLVSLLLYEKLSAKNQMVHVYINAVVIGMFILELSLAIPVLVRLSYYFIIFIVLLIPEIFQIIDIRGRRILMPAFSIILCLLMVKSGIPYQFMWQ